MYFFHSAVQYIIRGDDQTRRPDPGVGGEGGAAANRAERVPAQGVGP